MKSLLEESQSSICLEVVFSIANSFFRNHKMFAHNEGELRRAHVLMHTQRKSSRGVMIINETSIRFMF